MVKELSVEGYRKYCDPKSLGIGSSAEIGNSFTIIGQERAVRSLRFGMGIKEKGFNIFVSGMPGTGKTTTIKRFLEEMASQEPIPSDWCYVNNFADAYHPNALQLPAGRGKEFCKDIENLVASVKKELSQLFESEEYARQREQLDAQFQKQKEDLFNRLNETAASQGFNIQISPTGFTTIPLVNGEPLPKEKFLALTPEEKEDLMRKRQALEGDMDVTIRQVRQIDKASQEALGKGDREMAGNAIKHLFEELHDSYNELPEIVQHLEKILENVLDNLDAFQSPPEDKLVLPGMRTQSREPLEKRYQVNLVTDNSVLKSAPVIVEPNPSYNNLFGRIEQEARFGTLVTDYTLIRGGSLHQANGGYLVLPALDLIRNPLAWESLKRALTNDQIVIEDVSEKLSFATTKSLRPQPIPLNVKVILVGRPEIYQGLLAYDEHFIELFKVKADFDTDMPCSDENVLNYTRFISHLCEVEKLTHLDATAMARVVEHGSRIAEDQEKLSTRFGDISDVVREANYYAGLEKSDQVHVEHILKAIDEHFYRSSMYQSHILEMIKRGLIKIDIKGEQTGQVNGLSVLSLGDVAFGKPSRITASVGLGQKGVMDIEREAQLGGPTHTKGVMILGGFLADRFSRDKPLSLTARLAFEQSYSGVDGDSASSTELYAILSALSSVPIRQGIAVTGSVNQKGAIQAIGGVNHKIEGYYYVCKAVGLTGDQGVMIPASNLSNLMLKEEVLDAARAGKFHIWPISSIEEGIEVLTGIQAGQADKDGSYPDGSLFRKVDDRLRFMAETLAKFKAD